MPSLTACDMLLTAQALTAETGVRVELVPNTSTASTSRDSAGGFVISIPAMSRYDASVLPVTRGYLDHECGHVKFTNFVKMRSDEEALCLRMGHRAAPALVHRLGNVFEDFRIEQAMFRYYPGSRINLRKLNEHVFAKTGSHMDSFVWRRGASRVASLEARFLFLVECTFGYLLHCGYETIYSITLSSDTYRQMLCDFLPDHAYLGRLDSLVTRGVAATKQEEVLPLVEELINLWYDMFPDVARQAADPGCDHVHRGEPVKEDGGFERPSPIQQAADEMLSGTGDPDLHDAIIRTQLSSVTDCAAAFTDKGQAVGRLINTSSPPPERFDAMENIIAELGCLQSHMQPNLRVQDYNKQAEHVVARIENQTRGLLRSVLETMSFTRGKTGYFGNRLDTRVLYRSRIGDGRLFHTRAERQKLDTDIVILMDASSSMAFPISVANLAVQGIARALRSLPGVGVCIVTFGGQHFRPVALWDQPLPPWYKVPVVHGSTPLGGATVKAASLFGQRTAPRRMLFISSDGAPDNATAFAAALSDVRSKGIEVYGLAMGEGGQCLKQFIPNTCHTDFDLKNFVPTLRNALIKSFKEDRRCNT